VAAVAELGSLADFARVVKSHNPKAEWVFADPKNVAVFTTAQAMRLRQPVLRVTHDDDDGAWQFHTGVQPVSTADMMIVALEEMVEHDPTISELADLPCGWFAERDNLGSPWRRSQR
jgi:hypothetical protein